VTGLALLAVHQRIRKSANVSRSDPCLGIHDNSAVKSNVIS
jgi:hypothetical protein